MKNLLFLTLLFSNSIDSQRISFFNRQNNGLSFISTSREKLQWKSEPREFCFLRGELSYFIQYEHSPVPIPAFKVNGLSQVFISVDIDPAHPILFQRLRVDWEKLAILAKNEKICFDGAFLPASNPKDAAYIMIEKIEASQLKLAIQDYWSKAEE